MKKTLSIIIFALSLFSLFAQDTLEYGDLPYYYNNYYPVKGFIGLHRRWYNNFSEETALCLGRMIYSDSNYAYPRKCLGHSYVTSDSLKIYGIAAAYDTTFCAVYTPLDQFPIVAAYQYEWDSTSHSHFGNLTELKRTGAMSNIRHYKYRATVRSCNYDSYGNMTNIVELDSEIATTVFVYEYYFDQPVTVHDTFYIGVIQGTVPYPLCLSTGCMGYPEATETYGETVEAFMISGKLQLDMFPRKGHHFEYGGIFPIIRPLHGSDSTAIDMVDYSRMVSLAPNPTDGRFTVTSDDGLRAIVVYDMTGRAVIRRNASGSRAEIDASALPKGCYILAATTTNGVARKKLILR